MPLRTLQRGKDKPRLTRDQIRAARRVTELRQIYRHQYPKGLPHNGVGVRYCKYMLRTMAFLPDDRRVEWLDRNAPWLDASSRGYLLSLGPYWYMSRSLGQHLELCDDDREKLEAWSIEAIDVTEEERRMINLEKNRAAQERRRRDRGAKPQAESLSRLQPWKPAGVSRATFYRLSEEDRQALVDAAIAAVSGETTPSRPSLSLSRDNETVSLSQPDGPAIAGAKIIPLFPEKPKQPMPVWTTRDVEPLVLPLAA